eukprot:scaffold65079_cov40-Cyclotella_meneghiniana.AAC.1
MGHHGSSWVMVTARDDGMARPQNYSDDDLTRNFVPPQHRQYGTTDQRSFIGHQYNLNPSDFLHFCCILHEWESESEGKWVQRPRQIPQS